MAGDPRHLAPSPGMLGEPDDGPLQIFYIYLIEEADGFRWQVRGHDLRDPVETSGAAFASAEEARHAGQSALEKVCHQYRRLGLGR